MYLLIGKGGEFPCSYSTKTPGTPFPTLVVVFSTDSPSKSEHPKQGLLPHLSNGSPDFSPSSPPVHRFKTFDNSQRMGDLIKLENEISPSHPEKTIDILATCYHDWHLGRPESTNFWKPEHFIPFTSKSLLFVIKTWWFHSSWLTIVK